MLSFVMKPIYPVLLQNLTSVDNKSAEMTTNLTEISEKGYSWKSIGTTIFWCFCERVIYLNVW